jgi:hypothetical protein
VIDVICPASALPCLRGLKLELSFRNPAEMRTASGWRSALPSSSFLAAWDAMGHGPWAMPGMSRGLLRNLGRATPKAVRLIEIW